MIRTRVHVETGIVKDTLVLKVDPSQQLTALVSKLHETYQQWHAFPVYEFKLRQNEKVLDLSQPISTIASVKNPLEAFESEASIQRRAEEKRKAEDERRRREQERIAKEEKRRKRILELTGIGNCWTFEGPGPIEVPVESDGLIAINKGSMDHWSSIYRVAPIRAEGKSFFAIHINKSPPTSNTWRFCIGVVPLGFKLNAERRWVGSQKSWSYIGGNGGKCHNSGKHEQYGSLYGENDTIGVLLDYDTGSIEFFKNNVSQGVAFTSLSGPVLPAVSMTAMGAEVSFSDEIPPSVKAVVEESIKREMERTMQWNRLTSDQYMVDAIERFKSKREIVWDPLFSLRKDKALFYPDQSGSSVLNEGSGDKWRSARAIQSFDEGIVCFQFEIVEDADTVNTWRICIGVVPFEFKAESERSWVGSQNSWSYIAGTGGKSFNSGQSSAYGEPFGKGDVVSVMLDFEVGTIEFFRNGEPQRVAFNNLKRPVYPGISLTGTGTFVTLSMVSEEKTLALRQHAITRTKRLENVLKTNGNAWNQKKASESITFTDEGRIATNSGSQNKWASVLSILPYAEGRRYFEVNILSCPYTTNSWRISVGVVPTTFDTSKKKLWIGAQKSWGYIAGNGAKCHNSGKSLTYGSKFGKGDVIGVLMDFENKAIEFFKNGISQGIAFQDLNSPVFAAVSLTGTMASVELDGSAEKRRDLIDSLFLYE